MRRICTLSQQKREGLPSPVSCSALAEAVAAGAMLAIAGIAHMDGRQLTVHAVTVVLAVSHTAGNAAVDVVHALFPSFLREVWAIIAKISATPLTNAPKPCKIVSTEV